MRTNCFPRRASLALLLALCIAWILTAPAAAQTTVVAASGERSPDNSGDLSEFENPVNQSQGQAFFTATVRENGFLQSSDLFRATTGGQLTLLVKEGDPAPDGNGNYPTFAGDIPFVNELGQVAFGIRFENTLGNGIDAVAVLVGRGGTTPLTIAARANQVIPGSGGDRFDLLLTPFAFNNAGQVAFTSLTQDSELIGIWRAGTGGIVRIVWQGDAKWVRGRPGVSLATPSPLSRWGQFPIFTGVKVIHRATPIEVAPCRGITRRALPWMFRVVQNSSSVRRPSLRRKYATLSFLLSL